MAKRGKIKLPLATLLTELIYFQQYVVTYNQLSLKFICSNVKLCI